MGQWLEARRCPHPGHGSIGGKMVSLTRRMWTRYWARRAAHATVAILHSLDERALKDIGLDRSEIESVVYGEGPGREGQCRQKAVSAHPRERRVGMC